jgi:hypothetical protein
LPTESGAPDGAGRAAFPGRGGRGRGGARPVLKVTREPSLTTLAASKTGELSTRAASVLARVEWRVNLVRRPL